MHNRRHHLQTGYFVAEIAIAFVMLAALVVSLTMMVNRHNTAARVLSDRREAVRLAEQKLLSLQSRQIPAPASTEATITAQETADPEPIPGWRWVEVQVEHNGQSAVLYGLGRTALMNESAGGMP